MTDKDAAREKREDLEPWYKLLLEWSSQFPKLTGTAGMFGLAQACFRAGQEQKAKEILNNALNLIKQHTVQMWIKDREYGDRDFEAISLSSLEELFEELCQTSKAKE